MPIVPGINQSSPKWIRARVGHVTASRMGDLMKKLQSMKRSKKCTDYLDELVSERLHGYAATHDVTKDMLRGIELQPAAAAAYEIEKGVLLEDGGWWLHDRIPMFGASPDYLLPDGKGLVEIKVPRPGNHTKYLKYGWNWPDNNESNERYEWQIRAQLSVTRREYCDFVSFDPSLPQEHLRLWTKRFGREEAIIRGMEQEVEYFLAEVERETMDLIHLPKVVVMQQAAR